MATFEDALKKLDRIEQSLNFQEGEISNKDARILEQGNKIKQATDILKKKEQEIEQKQKNIQKLETELKNSEPKDAHVYAFLTHLQEDLKSELETKKTLKERVKDLELQTGDDELARDKELQDLRKELGAEKQKTATLTNQLATVQNIDNQVYKVLEQHSNANGLLSRSQEVINRFTAKCQEVNTIASERNNLRAQVANLTLELQKEKGWWDKWMKAKVHFTYIGKEFYLALEQNPFINTSDISILDNNQEYDISLKIKKIKNTLPILHYEINGKVKNIEKREEGERILAEKKKGIEKFIYVMKEVKEIYKRQP